MTVFAPLFMPGGIEVVVIALVAILLFGADKIPGLARAAGESLGEFQKGKEELEDEISE